MPRFKVRVWDAANEDVVKEFTTTETDGVTAESLAAEIAADHLDCGNVEVQNQTKLMDRAFRGRRGVRHA